jgi:Ca-activated chloride channel family protein
MRKFSTFFLLLAVFATSAPSGDAQTRARRVGQAGGRPAETPARAPQPSSDGSRGRDVQEEVGEDDVVRVDSTLVTLPVTVLDRDGRFIPTLRKQDFRVFEDGVEQEVAYFATVEAPFTVALVLDTSGSTRFKIEDIQDAAIAFVDELRSEDRVMIISFSDEIRVLSDPTNDRRRLAHAIRQARNGGGTRLYDAVDQVIKQHIDRLEGRKAVVLFTDGVDTTSRRASYDSTTRDAEELDAMIYPVQYDTYSDMGGGGGGGRGGGGGTVMTIPDILGTILGGRRGRGGGGGGWPGRGRGGGGGGGSSREDYERGGRYLRELATLTGGRHYEGYDLENIRRAFSNIAEELRRQYSLGYYPTRQAQASERRQIKVRVKRPNLVVRARDSYVYRPAGSNSTTAQGNENRPAPAVPVRRPFSEAPAANR